MHPTLQRYLDALEPLVTDHYYQSLEKVLEGWSSRDDEYSVRCADVARKIVTEPIGLRERTRKLHRFVIDMCPSSYDG